MPQACLWEILVPTVRPEGHDGKYFSARYHRVWDARVREITGGLTVMQPARGQWVSPTGETFVERMIPVRIVATREQIELVIDHTIAYYDQQAVLCYKLSDEVILRHRDLLETKRLARSRKSTAPGAKSAFADADVRVVAWPKL